MSIPTYRCWLADETEEDGRDRPSAYLGADGAAAEYAETLCDGDTDYYDSFASGRDVCVRDGDRVRTFVVSVDWSPNFNTMEKR